jgi:type IV pilus assembly protein PilY1
MNRNDLPSRRPARDPLIKRIGRVLMPLVVTTTTIQPLANAAPNPSLLSQQPKFVDVAVDSNVAFIMDDSLSMEDIRLPVPAGLNPGESTGGTVTIRGAATGFANGSWSVGPTISGLDRNKEWIYRTSRLNPLYYNPAITYKAWNDNGRDGASGFFGAARVGTPTEITESNGFRTGVTPHDMRYAGPNYEFGSGNNFSRRLTTTGANPPPVPQSICGNVTGDPAWPGFCRNRAVAGGFEGVIDSTAGTPRNQDLFTSPMILADGGQTQCTVTPTSPTVTSLPTIARGSTAQPSTARTTETRPSTPVPTTTRTDQPRAGQARPSYTRATQTRPSTTPTTAAATITTRTISNRTVTVRQTQTRPSTATTATTDRTITTRPSTALPTTTDRTITTRSSTTLQSPINRTVTTRVTEYRYETGVCGSGSWSAWSTTQPGTNYCSNPTSEGVSVSKIETRQSDCPSGSSVDPNNSNQCLSDCPSGTTASGSQCVYSCPSGTTLISGQCYSACPSGTSVNSSNETQCISNCPSGTTATATQCVGTCPTGTTLIGSQCYSACPSGTSINTDATQCISNCPSGTTPTATQCLGGSCPSGTNLISGQCYSACPSGYAINGSATSSTQCIQNCPSGSAVDPNNSGQCLSNCPTGTTVLSTTQCIANCPSGTTQDPNNANQCLSCTSGTLNATTAQCTNICPTGSNLISGVCYGACPSGYTINGSATTSTQCIQSCATGETASGSICLQACPSDYPNRRTTTSTTCYAACPSGFSVAGTNNDTNYAICRSNCPSGYTATSATTCTGTCASGTNLISSQCYGNCNSGFTIDGSASTSTQCISDCPSGSTASGSQCYGACPVTHPTLVGTPPSATCYADCTGSYPTVNPSNPAQCQGACPSGTTQSGTQCLSCPSDNTVLPSGQCCPTVSTTQGNCPLPFGQTCVAGRWYPNPAQPAPARYYVFAPASATATDLSDPANYVQVEINRDRQHSYPSYSGREVSDLNGDGAIDAADVTAALQAGLGLCLKDECTWEAEAQNFANWFTYYRTRLASAIAVTSESLSGLTRDRSLDGLRLAYGSINYFPDGADPYSTTGGRLPLSLPIDGRDDHKGTLVRGVRPFTEVSPPPDYCATADPNNAALCVGRIAINDRRQEVFDWLFSLRAIASTPNREALDSVGRYFSRDDERGPWIQPNGALPIDPSTGTAPPTVSGRWSSNEDRADHISCRRNYTIMITDGEWTNQPSTSQQPLVESRGTPLTALTTSATRTGPGGRSYTYDPANEVQFSTNASATGGTLSDIAFNYWITDLRPDVDPVTGQSLPGLSNTIRVVDPTTGSQGNPAFWQHMVPYLIGYGISATMDTAGTRSAIAASVTTPQTVNWPSVGMNPLTITDRDAPPLQPVDCAYDPLNNRSGCGRVDDTMRAAMASRGDFLAATDVGRLSQGVASAFTAIGAIEGSGTALTGRSGTLRTGERLFAAIFRTNVWTGRVQSFDAAEYFLNLASSTNPPSVDSRFPAAASRNILTSTVNGSGSVVATTFPTGASDFTNLSAAQRAQLNNDATLVQWLRGDQSRETNAGGPFRNRPAGEIMGSIVNSQPIYSKAPDAGYQSARKPAADTSSGNAYRDFVNLNKQYRPARIYVGSNSGMLHAFDVTGSPATNSNYMNEVFAYVPRAVYGGLPALASPTYIHRYLVDGPIVEGDVFTGGAWRTVIVGTTGAGPKGVFALDVTQRTGSTATTMTSSQVLWDIDAAADTSTNIEHLGNILQPGVIGSGKDGNWYYFVGNGYESQNDKAKLLAINLTNGAIFAVDTDNAGGSNPAAANVDQRPNGLGGVTPVYDANRNIVAIYAGDRLGRLWKFDLSSTSRSAWSSTQLFTATDPSGNRQPITAAPRIVPHPLGGRMVVFGTGRLFERDDIVDQSVQSVYGVWEKNTSSPATVTKSSLRQFSLANLDAPTGERFRQLSGTTALNWTTDLGWYYNLAVGTDTNGERVIAAPTENYGFVNITSYEPSANGDPCQGGGLSFFYRLDVAGSFTRSPFAATGPITNLPNSPPLNTVVGTELTASTVTQLQTLLKPVDGTTNTSTTLSQTDTAAIANRTASAATNPCLGSQAGGPSRQALPVSSPSLSCPVAPLRTWRELPRNPR